MWIFFKAQISSLLATLADFSVTIMLAEIMKMNVMQATVAGAVTGAFTNFFINKYWSFESGASRLKQQGIKYFMVWTGSVLLNTLGVYVLTGRFGLGYIASKIMAAIVVGIAFNYTLQRHYVFAKNEKAFSK